MNIDEIEKQVIESFGIDPGLLPVAGSEDEKFKAFRDLLRRRIEELAERDMEKLMWVLYRIDVSERKLYETMKQASPENFSSAIADLIIERQIQKINTRKQFGENETEWNFDI
jgi:hypothetical protein